MCVTPPTPDFSRISLPPLAQVLAETDPDGAQAPHPTPEESVDPRDAQAHSAAIEAYK